MRISDWSSDVCSSDLGRGVLDFKRRCNLCAAPFEPDDVNQSNRIQALPIATRPLLQAAVPQKTVCVFASAIIRCNPDIEAQRHAHVSQPALVLGMGGITFSSQQPLLLRGGRLFTYALMIALSQGNPAREIGRANV